MTQLDRMIDAARELVRSYEEMGFGARYVGQAERELRDLEALRTAARAAC